MPKIPGGNPIPLGEVVVTAAGTPVPILKNFTDVDTAAEIKTNTLVGRLMVKSILIKPKKANVGNIIVRKRGVSGSDGILAELGNTESYAANDEQVNMFNLWDFEIDATVSAESAYVSATRL